MKLVLIPPFSMLWWATTGQDYQLLLPENFRNQDYAEWARASLGDPQSFTILDNGLAEDRQIEDMAFLALASYIKPDELIVPDIAQERRATINSALDFIDLLRSQEDEHPYHGRLAFVAQGRDIRDTFDCAKQCIDHPLLEPYVKTIMI